MMDDLITASRTPEEHIEQLEKLFERIIMHKLTLGIYKCFFFQEKEDFLGFEITQEGMRPGASKTEVIKQMTLQDTLKTLRGFVGLTNYRRGTDVWDSWTDIFLLTVKTSTVSTG